MGMVGPWQPGGRGHNELSLASHSFLASCSLVYTEAEFMNVQFRWSWHLSHPNERPLRPSRPRKLFQTETPILPAAAEVGHGRRVSLELPRKGTSLATSHTLIRGPWGRQNYIKLKTAISPAGNRFLDSLKGLQIRARFTTLHSWL
jgi:hypothetical protein